MSDDEEGYKTPEEQTWLREKTIGAGGFGVVDLYRHPVSLCVVCDQAQIRWPGPHSFMDVVAS